MIDEILIYLSIFDFSSIFNNLVASFISIIIGITFFQIIINKLKNKSIFQTYIYTSPQYIVCEGNKYSIEQIPSILAEYRKKLYSTDNKEELMLWNTRISTFIIFTDGKRVLVLDRSNNIKDQLVINEKIDCHGAFKFHNPSIPYKLPKEIMSSKVLKLESIPGIALEQNSKELFNIKIPYKREIAVMLGFVAYLKPEDLDKGEGKDNKIISLSCLSAENTNLTSKTKLGVKHLLTLHANKKQKKKILVKLVTNKNV